MVPSRDISLKCSQNPRPQLGVQTHRRLVEQQHTGRVHQCDGEAYSLAHAAADPEDNIAAPVEETNQLERRFNSLPPGRSVGHTVHSSKEADVLLNGKLLVQRIELRHIADAGRPSRGWGLTQH